MEKTLVPAVRARRMPVLLVLPAPQGGQWSVLVPTLPASPRGRPCGPTSLTEAAAAKQPAANSLQTCWGGRETGTKTTKRRKRR